MYDICKRSTFEAVQKQIELFCEYNGESINRNIVLVGNKTDREEEREVLKEEAIKLAQKLNLSAVFESSAKDGSNVKNILYRAIVDAFDQSDAMGSVYS